MATWAKGVDFKNSGNTARVGGVGIYGTDDNSLNGTKGGSSQCFAILVEGDLAEYEKLQ